MDNKNRKDQRTNKTEPPCCKAKTCHKNCPVEWDNPFCHDTFCRECHQVLLDRKDAAEMTCGRCGWWCCDSCHEKVDYSSMNDLPDLIKNRIKSTKDYCIKCKDEKY